MAEVDDCSVWMVVFGVVGSGRAVKLVGLLAECRGLLCLSSCSKGADKKRKHVYLDLPDGSGFGDHIQLLQIYESWDKTGHDPEWCKEHGLQVRGMMFVKDVRKQLAQIMQKMAKGPLEVQGSHKRRESLQDYKNLRKALCVGYGNQLAERNVRHNGYRTLGVKSQLVQVHPSSVLKPDEEGMLPNYVVYHELIATSRPFMRNVCGVEMSWVLPIFKKLENLNVNKLSGGTAHLEDQVPTEPQGTPKKEVNGSRVPDDRESRIQAARDRFLARKSKK
ncbi:hypothetical protein Ancab_021348 [Ancistrocladus abbreviatus]